MYKRTVGALVPIGWALTNAKPRKLDTEWKKNKQKNRISTYRSSAYYVSAGQKQAQICAEGCEGENFTQIL